MKLVFSNFIYFTTFCSPYKNFEHIVTTLCKHQTHLCPSTQQQLVLKPRRTFASASMVLTWKILSRKTDELEDRRSNSLHTYMGIFVHPSHHFECENIRSPACFDGQYNPHRQQHCSPLGDAGLRLNRVFRELRSIHSFTSNGRIVLTLN